ncbi:hypothetical protein AVEN_114360-1 [Araneus ventricosus]|uniref:Uncharacterized protein n=1 Tax=Araneus ventricosus TaxID=182803 RepID=A0A4Y2TL45_ARAVE|nr:hypothetical protein AVEN_114360-1 [Araneus ventricosus]
MAGCHFASFHHHTGLTPNPMSLLVLSSAMGRGGSFSQQHFPEVGNRTLPASSVGIRVAILAFLRPNYGYLVFFKALGLKAVFAKK